MKKKLLSIVLSVFMLIFGISLLPITASAETEDASEQVTSATYKQVTSDDDLVAGAKYLIVCPSKGKAMGAQSGTHRQGVDVTITDDRTNGADGVQVVTLGGVAGAWTLAVSNTEYLYWDNANDVKTGETPHEWTIVIENDGTATIASKNTPARKLQWNAGQPRFACYMSNQTEIAFFKLCAHANTEDIGEAKDATCTEEGSETGLKCTDCGEVIKEQATIPATGHADVNPVDSKCDVCGANLCAEHVWVDGEVITEPTCTATGIQAQYCENCNQPGEDKVLDRIAHTPQTDEPTAPTCTETGLTEGSHCSVCQEVLTAQEILPMVAHKYDNGTCSVCRDMVVSGKQLAVFEFGDNGEAKHKDGSEITAGKEYADGDYTLSLTTATKVYDGAFDEKGNSALKLGASNTAASFSFTVGEKVTQVVISIAGYKANLANISVNGVAYTIISKSNNGVYTNIVVNTATEKTVTLATVSGSYYRAMINSITFLEEENAAVGEANELAGYTVTLGDSIGVNFYMALTAETIADEGAYMQFTLPNGNVETVSVQESQANGAYYKFTCYVAVKETVDDITAQLYNASGALTDAYTYSVKEYATYIVNAGSYTEKEVALAKALLNYGGYAQVMFDYKTDALANAELSEEDKTVAEVTVDKTYEKSVTGTVTGVTYRGTSTVWEADMAIRHYLTISDESVTFTLYDAEGNFIKDLALLENENGKYVAIDGIVAKDMATAYTLVISNGAEEQRISYSVYSYFYDILSSDAYEEDEKNAMRAAYLYAEAAIAYLAK